MMLRRSLIAAALAALAACGAASAALLDDAPPATTTTTTTLPETTTVPIVSTAPTTTFAVTTTAPATTTTTPAPATGTAAPAIGKPAVTFLLAGHGWGHGAGLSQWGAKGYAEHGWTADRILAHYYPGTQLGPAPVGQVRVLLAEGAKSLKLASASGWSVLDGEGQTHPLEPGKLTLGVALKVDGVPLPPPLTFRADGTPLQLGAKQYRGELVVQTGSAGKLLAIDVVGVEDYLKGVVPAEMPQAWPAEALKAQAIAARSYALANRATGKPYDLFSDTRSQMYLGVSAETKATSAAIDATAGKVLTYGGAVISAYFSSSSGGRTAAGSETFSSGKPIPWLVSVDDPYDASPYKNWTQAIDGAKAAKALGVKGPLLDLAPVIGPSGRVVTATLKLPLGQSIVTGTQLRSALGLRSTWFTLGLLSLTPPPKAVVYGQKATIEGVARGVADPVLEQRSGSVLWESATLPKPASDGSFSFVVKPLRTTDYRLGTGTTRGTPARVRVQPAIAFGAGMRGTVKPVVPGKQVQIQQLQGTRWKVVTTVDVAADGSFSAGALGSGSFRARYAPGAGLVAGASAPLVVP
jgi:stage II sporulation protein D